MGSRPPRSALDSRDVRTRLTLCLVALAGCGRWGFGAGDRPDAQPGDSGIAGLVVTYPMDNDPQAGGVVASSSELTGTCSPCPFPTTGHIGQAYSFDGTRRITLPPASSSLVGIAPYSAAAWFRPAGGGTIFAKPLSATDITNSSKLFMDATTLYWETASSSTMYEILGAPVVLSNSWHHVAITWDGATKRLYFDGTLVGTATAIPIDSTYPISIGLDLDRDLPVDTYQGGIDELEFYGRALDAAEVVSLSAM